MNIKRDRRNDDCFWLAMLVLLMSCAVAPAKTVLEVESGYDGRYRIGRWSPVMITVQSDKPMNALLEVRVPTASESIVNINQVIGIGTEKQTYIVYAPLSLMYDPLRVTLKDAGSRRVIAEFPDRDITAIDRGNDQLGFLMITTGRNPAGKNLQLEGIQGTSLAEHLKQSLLPITPIGYDAADLVLMNNPEWSGISTDQQRALIDWIRAGGVLLIQPGADPVPEDALIGAILPGILKPLTTIELNQTTREQFELGNRFKTIGIRPIEPATDARTFDLLGSDVKITWKTVGLGRIGIVPIDLSTLQFNDSSRFQLFWGNLIKNSTGLKSNIPTGYNYYGENPSQRAAHQALDLIGQIPHTGAFGFSYIALTICVLMLIVGPIDYFVLKKIGRQPWTWATTIGWIGLITTGALYAGSLMRSGDLHLRTLSLIDQAEDKIVGADDIALIYSPKSDEYVLKSSPVSWWQPVPSGNVYSSRDSMTPPLETHQDYRGNQLYPMWIDIWNWRFLRGTRFLDEPPYLKAELKITGTRITGTISNLSPQTLTNIEVYYHTNFNAIELPVPLKPGETREVDLLYQPKKEKKQSQIDVEMMARRRDPSADRTIQTRYYSYLFGLSEQRNIAVDRLAEDEFAVVFATIQNPVTEIKIDESKTKVFQDGQAVIRAIFPLEK